MSGTYLKAAALINCSVDGFTWLEEMLCYTSRQVLLTDDGDDIRRNCWKFTLIEKIPTKPCKTGPRQRMKFRHSIRKTLYTQNT